MGETDSPPSGQSAPDELECEKDTAYDLPRTLRYHTSDLDECDVETSALSRDEGLGDAEGEEVESVDVQTVGTHRIGRKCATTTSERRWTAGEAVPHAQDRYSGREEVQEVQDTLHDIQVELRSAEVDQTRDSDGYVSHSTHGPSRRDGDKHEVATDAPGRYLGRGGRVEVQDKSRDVERDLERENDGNGVGYDGTWCRMDSAANDARNKSK